MTVTIGIFQNEEKVLEAIKLFQAVHAHNSLRIVVKNQESAPILTAQTDIPVEEMYEILDAQGRGGVIGVAPIGAGGYSATGATGAGPAPGGIIVGGLKRDDERATKGVMRDIGIPGDYAKECGEAVEAGRYLLITESEENTEVEAEALFIQAGASDIFH
ncbi:hypothetical protein FHS15_004120 [Paenibacillus castaneae]|uniref:hypothetical protein n=1 Tax=Paenibacillus castaneae TaxID=474957 RepID=UPI000C9A5299|nr:hypothetical protein [Paenibacillus castaneae]NIK78974.1 hypothetical protein [Paenibacillus castaneae]